MGKTSWTILILGVVGAGCVLMAMVLSLQSLAATPAGARARFAEGVRARFGFQAVGLQTGAEDGRKILRVTYEIRRDAPDDEERLRQEMKEVAEHVSLHYPDERERREIEVIRVTRTALRSRGCREERRTVQENFPNPARIAAEKFRYDR